MTNETVLRILREKVIDKSNEFRAKQADNRYARLKGQAPSHAAKVLTMSKDRKKRTDESELVELSDKTLMSFKKKVGAQVKAGNTKHEPGKIKAQKILNARIAKKGKEWHKANPINHMNIVNHYNAASEEHKRVGHHWYSDAHHMTKEIAHGTNTPMHHMAGLVANYSPQTHWFQNIHTAAHVARHKTPVGGPGSGVFASGDQKKAAHRIMSGEHYNHVLKGHKIKAFAHLIEHGGDHPDDKEKHVVVDRHAHSVASGKRITDAAFSQAGLKGHKQYQKVSQAYRDAAAHLSHQHNTTIHPHQVQAVTWLHRQHLNAQEERADAKSQSKTAARGVAAKKKWDQYAGEHHPSIAGKEPGTGYNENYTEFDYNEDYNVDWFDPEDLDDVLLVEYDHEVKTNRPNAKTDLTRIRRLLKKTTPRVMESVVDPGVGAKFTKSKESQAAKNNNKMKDNKNAFKPAVGAVGQDSGGDMS